MPVASGISDDDQEDIMTPIQPGYVCGKPPRTRFCFLVAGTSPALPVRPKRRILNCFKPSFCCLEQLPKEYRGSALVP